VRAVRTPQWAMRIVAPSRRDTDRGGSVRRLRTGLVGLVLVFVAGTVGYMAFGFGLLDSLFQTVITVSTVGFGEVHHFDPGEKVFTIVLILAGVGTAAYTFSLLIETFVEGYLADTIGRRRMERKLDSMHDHVILCGWGRVGNAIAAHLQASQSEVVVIDGSAERIASIDGPSVLGDATDEEVLHAAGIDRARVLVTALNTDADNLYVTLTARSMRPDLFIVSRTASAAAVPKLLQAGADRVVNAVAAYDLYGGPCVVVDLGTATTFDAISAAGEYLGGAITPGVAISLEALFQHAAALRRVELVPPRGVIGRSTVESIQSGALYGFAAQVDGLCRRFIAEMGPSTVVATGGLSELIAPYAEVVDHVEPWLTLHGLRIVYEMNVRTGSR